jgi:O-antigen/teichoic acid export membrane protein
LVTLDVHDDVPLLVSSGHLGHPIAAACVLSPGQLDVCTESEHDVGNALVVGRHDHIVECGAASGGLVDPLNKRPALQVRERFTWKTGGCVPNRYDGDYLHAAILTGRLSRHAPVRSPTVSEPGSQAIVEDVLATADAEGRAVRGGAIRIAGYALGLALSLVSVPLLTRHLGVTAFGSFVTVLSLASIVSLAADAGLTIIGVREYTIRTSWDRSRLIANILSFRLLIASGGMLLAIGFAALAGYEPSLIAGTALAGAGVLLFAIHQTYAIPLAAELRLGLVTSFELLRQVLTVGGVLALIAVGASVTAFLALSIPVGLVMAVVTAIAIRKVGGRRPGIDRHERRLLLQGAIPVAAASILAALFYKISVVMMSVLSNDQETGYFSASLRVVEVIIPVASLITSAAFPLLVRSAAEAPTRLANGMQRLFEVACILGAATALALVVGAEPIIQFIGGNDFDRAVPVLQIQGVATATSFLFAIWAAGLLAIGAQKSLLLATLGGVGAVITLTGILAPTHGAIGAAIAMTISGTLLAAVAGFLLMRHRELRVSVTVLPKVALAMACGVLMLLLDAQQILVAFLAEVAYFAVLLLLGAIPPEVRTTFLRPIGRG